MDGIQAVVAVELLDLVLARVAVAAVHLDGQVVGGQAPLGRPALGDRCEDVEQQGQARALGRIVCDRGLVDDAGAIQVERQPAFDIRLLRQQHAPDVGMADDLRLWTGGVLAGRADGPALRPLPRIVQRVQVAGVAQRHRAQADADACLVHHVEHVGQTLVRLAYQVADRAGFALRRVARAFAKVEQAVDRAAIAHLVVHAGQLHVVALAQLSVLVDQELGHQQQRDAFHTGDQLSIRSRDLAQHQVHDVLGQLVVAT